MQLAFRFGQSVAELVHSHDRVAVHLPNPLLVGPSEEPWAEVRSPGRECRRFTLWRSGDERWGVGFAVTDGDFCGAAEALYRDLFRAAGDVTLHRIWNFIPRINDHDRELENYRAFCQGRHAAFEAHFGRADELRMPAASAVGTRGDALCAVFVAGTASVRHVENPQQVPAYRYPSRYGPRAPSFARGSLVTRAAGPRLYVSGTASIRHSESCHEGDVVAQCELAIDNMDLVARAAGLPALTSGAGSPRRFRIYLRDPADWPAVRGVVARRLRHANDVCSVLQADICRRELLVELEACVDIPDQPTLSSGGAAPVRY